MIFRPFKRSDVSQVWTHFLHLKPGDAEAYLDVLDKPFLSYTYEREGDVLGIGGASILMPGVAEIWIGFGPAMWYHPIEVCKGLRQALFQMVHVNNLHRVQFVVDPENETAKRFAKFMGFEFEGIMRQYSIDRQDMARYARCF